MLNFQIVSLEIGLFLNTKSAKKVPAKVPAKRVKNGLKPIQKNLLGLGLTVGITGL